MLQTRKHLVQKRSQLGSSKVSHFVLMSTPPHICIKEILTCLVGILVRVIKTLKMHCTNAKHNHVSIFLASSLTVSVLCDSFLHCMDSCSYKCFCCNGSTTNNSTATASCTGAILKTKPVAFCISSCPNLLKHLAKQMLLGHAWTTCDPFH